MRIQIARVTLLMLLVAAPETCFARQKGQYILGTNGLKAGIQPAPGFAYADHATFLGASRLKGADVQPIPVTGSSDFRLGQNFFMHTSNLKLFGGTYGAMFDLVIDSASVTAPLFGVSSGGAGVTDTYVRPFFLGDHFPRTDFRVNFAFLSQTGRNAPGSPQNNGSGYSRYMPSFGSPIYLTKNKGTSLSVFSLYEFHGKKRDSNITPGQAFNLEWGPGQMLPAKSNLLPFGAVGYGQRQTSANGGPQPACLENSRYAVTAIGPQAMFVVPKCNMNFFFRYETEFAASARPEGTTLDLRRSD
jgi:hypothetical protein